MPQIHFKPVWKKLTCSKIWIYTYIFMFQLKNYLMMIKRYFTQFNPFSHSVRSNFLWPCGLQHASFPVHHQLPEFTQTHVHRVSDAIQPSHPLSSPSLPAFNLSQHQGLFQGVSSLHQVAKVLDSFSISPSNDYSGLISFRMDWLDLLSVQGTLKTLLHHQSSKAHRVVPTLKI